jgi:hypothetical protein
MQPWAAADADDDVDGVYDLNQVLQSFYFWQSPTSFARFAGPQLFSPSDAGQYPGGTSIGHGVNRACQLAAQATLPDRRAVILSDGFANDFPRIDVALSNCTVLPVIDTVAIGSTARCDRHAGTSTQYGFGTLQEIADATGGECFRVLDPSNLPDFLPRLLNPVVVGLSMTVDGGDPIDLSDAVTSALPYRGSDPLPFSTTLTDVEEDTEICITVQVEDGGEVGAATACTTLQPNQRPVADAGPDQTVVEGDFVALDGLASVDPDGDALTYRWELVGQPGAVTGRTAADEPRFAFQALDDGEYVVELSVSDGDVEETDRVTIVVGNADPALEVVPSTDVAEGVVLLSTRTSDKGTQDRHEVVVDWGDGMFSAYDAAAQGYGWSSVLATHAYAEAGAYTVLVEVHDGEHGVDARMVEVVVDDVDAAWAGSTSAPSTLKWHAQGSGAVFGDLHSNRDVVVRGTDKALDGLLTYVTTTDLHPSFTPTQPPRQVPGETYPRFWDGWAYGPGGEAARRAGDDWHDHTADCAGGSWAPGALSGGVHWVPCPVEYPSGIATSPMTLISTHTIRIVGSGGLFTPYMDGLSLLAMGGQDTAVDFAATDATVLGHVFAPYGGIDLDGANNQFSVGCTATASTCPGVTC